MTKLNDLLKSEAEGLIDEVFESTEGDYGSVVMDEDRLKNWLTQHDQRIIEAVRAEERERIYLEVATALNKDYEKWIKPELRRTTGT